MKVAVTTVLDDKYFAGFLITLNSFLCVTKIKNWDLVILEWGNLRDEYKSIIKSLYPNTYFRSVETNYYSTHQYDTTWRTWTYNCNYRFDIFTFTDYDRVIFIDSDIIFQLGLEEILEYDVDFAASRAQYDSVVQISTPHGFDGGLMTIGKKFLNFDTRDKLIEIALQDAPPDVNINSNKWVSDEPILNTYFLDKMSWLPNQFNHIVATTTFDTFNSPANYQFTGHNKPWYGNTLEEQFSPYVFESISEIVGNGVQVPLILKRLLKFYNFHVSYLKDRYDIDVLKYTGYIQPET